MPIIDGIDLLQLPKLAKRDEVQIRKAFDRIRKRKPKNLDKRVHELHQQAFQRIDCLSCANCCRSLGPRLTEKDIGKLAKHLRISHSQFVEQYLRIDEDNDQVFAAMPCPFLADDNYCLVYEHRPKACREYPHTDRRRFVQLLRISLQNRACCPAVYQISKQLASEY